jgi:hypothetical protein
VNSTANPGALLPKPATKAERLTDLHADIAAYLFSIRSIHPSEVDRSLESFSQNPSRNGVRLSTAKTAESDDPSPLLDVVGEDEDEEEDASLSLLLSWPSVR